MKKTVLTLIAATALATAANADVKVTLPASSKLDELHISYAPLSNMLQARTEAELGIRRDTIAVKNNTAVFPLSDVGTCRYSIDLLPDGTNVDFYASPGEDVTVSISSVTPLEFTTTGTPLMDGINRLRTMLLPIEQKVAAIKGETPADMAALNAVYDEYEKTVIEFIQADPASPAAVFALLNLSGENFADTFRNLPPQAAETPFYPFAVNQNEKITRRLESAKTQQAMEQGHVLAPDFTLDDINGNRFTLSSLRGKWVILDFWGSWCGWCIKGFPALKDCYEQYKDKMEIVGVDCRDSVEAWKSAVERFGLPWIHVYCPDYDTALLQKYGVTGFPTKILIDPEGKISKIAVGEDPQFYDIVAEKVK